MDDGKFDKIFDTYYLVFEENFPMMHYQSASKEEMYEMMRECIAQNKDAQQLYPVNMEEIY